MHAFWLVLNYDLLEDRRIDDAIIKTFALCYFKMAESFENLDDILADWVNEDFEKSLVEAVDSYDKQEKERKSRFSVENDLTKLLEQSQSNATKRNTFARTSVTHSAAPRVPFFRSYHILTSSVIYYWTDARQLGIYLLSRFALSQLCKEMLPSQSIGVA